jgi:hypothetical protein
MGAPAKIVYKKRNETKPDEIKGTESEKQSH